MFYNCFNSAVPPIVFNLILVFIHNSNYWPTGVYNAVTLIKLNQVDYDLLVNNFKNIYEQEKAKGLVLIDVPIHSFQIQREIRFLHYLEFL